MKTSIPLIFLIQILSYTTYSQTQYGTSAGTLGSYYSYFGHFAGKGAQNTSYENSFFGYSCGKMISTGYENTAIGSNSLRENTTGYANTAQGAYSLRFNTTGHSNTAIGRSALYSNQNGYENVAIGVGAMLNHTFGHGNVAIGNGALSEPVNSFGNIAIGRHALKYSVGSYNTVTGTSAMLSLQAGSYNSAYGYWALTSSWEGTYNSAFGSNSMLAPYGHKCEDSYNSAFGGHASSADCGFTNFTSLGYYALATASNQVRLGNTDVTSIGGQVAWSNLSDGRFKKDIKSDVAGMEFIKNLKPVSYIVDKDALTKFLKVPDSLRVPTTEAARNERQVGFVAQEVEALIRKSGFVFSGVESPKNENDLYAIRYGEFVVPLVKAMQELIAEVEQLKQQLSQNIEESTTAETIFVGASLNQNNPNPFSNYTEIQMELPETTRQANLIVYNLEGKQLKSIVVNERGKANVKISGNELSAGMYLYTLIADGKVVDSKRLILTN